MYQETILTVPNDAFREEHSTFGCHLKTIEDDCRDLKRTLPNQLREVRNDLIKKLEDQRSSDLQDSSGVDHCLSHIKQQLQAVQSMLTDIPLQHRILRHLIADNMDSRRNQILDANPDTCRWILEDNKNYLEASERKSDSDGGSSPDSTSDVDSGAGSGSSESSVSKDEDSVWKAELQHRCEIRTRFTNWLATGQDVLHVSGKAGSGKSTLMKFIAQHERTREELKAWAGTKRLIFCQFYFWAAGTESQQSMPGLYRSLLFQTLSECPELIEKVFCTQVDRMRRSGARADPTVERVQGFDDAQIQAAFELLLKQAHDADYRMCFLLDGLDEFKGKPLEHEDLALKLKSWTLDGSVKLLVSSRPWPEFKTVFVANATIHLHRLNHFDIRTYCFRKLEQDRGFNQIREKEDILEIKDVVDDIVFESQGIFLWAHLVLDNILHGIRQGDSITTLRAKVGEYPADLDSLYDKLREPIEKKLIDNNRASRMLLLAVNAPDRFYLPAIACSWILDDSNAGLLDPEFPTDNEIRPYSKAEADNRIQRVIKQINSLTRGLLELDYSPGYRAGFGGPSLNTYFASPGIRFCHKSARDYLVSNEARYQRACASWPGFHDSDVYGRIHLARLLYGGFDDAEGFGFEDYIETMEHSYCRDFNPKTIRKFEAPLKPYLPGRQLVFGSVDFDIEHAIDEEISFAQFCAYCSLDTFVLSETLEHSKHLHSKGSSILIPIAQASRDFQKIHILLQLLNRRVGIDLMIAMSKSEGNGRPVEEFNLPAWVVVTWLLLDNMRYIYVTREDGNGYLIMESAVAALRCLHEHGEQVGKGISFTLGILEDGPRGPGLSKAKRQFSSAEIVGWLQKKSIEMRSAAATYGTEDQAQWSGSAPTADDNHPTDATMQHTLTTWLKGNSDHRMQTHYWPLEVCVLHWESIHVDIENWGVQFIWY